MADNANIRKLLCDYHGTEYLNQAYANKDFVITFLTFMKILMATLLKQFVE